MPEFPAEVRSAAAAARAEERRAERRRADRARSLKARLRSLELDGSPESADAFEDYLHVLAGVHRAEPTPRYDWASIAHEPPPRPPGRRSHDEDFAIQTLAEYRPSGLDKMTGRDDRHHDALMDAVAAARLRDGQAWRDAQAEHEHALAEHTDMVGLATEMMTGVPDAFDRALRSFGPFAEIVELGSEVAFAFDRPPGSPAQADAVRATALVTVHGRNVIPRTVRGRLPSGRIITSTMSREQYHALHQDYVCGCVLRVASEALALLPLDGILVTAQDAQAEHARGRTQDVRCRVGLRLAASARARQPVERRRVGHHRAGAAAPDAVQEARRLPARPGAHVRRARRRLGRRSAA